MVVVKIVIEGGIMPNSNDAALTISNSEKLRESFHKLLSQIVPQDNFSIEVEMGAGEKNACKSFKEHSKQHKCSLLIDLDGSIATKTEKLKKLELGEYSDFVFFMVQKMEAWILSQPEAIELAMETYSKRKPDQSIKDDSIFEQNTIDIQHPDDKLNTILSRYYFSNKRGGKKKKKYGKLKDSHSFISKLNASKLIESFDDARRLSDFFVNKTT